MQILLILIISLFALLSNKPGVKPFRISGYAQGTTYQISYYATDSIVTQRQTDSILLKIDSSLSIYKPYSLIAKFNNSEKELVVDKMLYTVVKKSLQIFKETDGAFDITVKPLVEAWGFGTKRISGIPDSTTIKNLLACVGSENIHLNKRFLIKDKPCTQIDVNGIAQGYSVDLLTNFLDKKGIQHYLVELGGEIRVKGRKQPYGELMTVGIDGPSGKLNQLPVQKAIQISRGAITTSGNYNKYYKSNNKHISHLIDPKTGYPIQNELISVTVIAEDAITADGYDNALMGMGLEKAMLFAKQNKAIEAYFIYRKQNGLITDTATAGFYKFIKN